MGSIGNILLIPSLMLFPEYVEVVYALKYCICWKLVYKSMADHNIKSRTFSLKGRSELVIARVPVYLGYRVRREARS